MTQAPSAEQREHLRVVVIGAGFGGLGAAVRLRQAGVTDFAVLERADAVGGTWRDNTYPGCACDVPSHLYSFSFAPNPRWPRNFSGQPHIRDYLERVADSFGLRPHIRLGAEVLSARWDTDALRWEVRTAEHTLTADVLVSATGPLSDPRIPDIPGLETFPGEVFHSARWNHDFRLSGRKVAMVGTGASAIQIVPSIQPEVDRLTLFQRTPPWVLPRMDRKITGWERWLHTHLPLTRRLRRQLLWTVREMQVGAFAKRPRDMAVVQALARAHMRRAIRDPELRRRLTPDYRIGCKRILLSNDYYPALVRPNVDLVASGLAEVRGSTLVAQDGTTAEADALVFGTGFRVTDMPIADRITGANGTTLAEEWKDGMEGLRGTTAAAFPNLLTIIGPNTGLGNSSMILIIEAQLHYLIDYLRKLRDLEAAAPAGGRLALVPRREAVAEWNAHLQRRMARSVWNTGGCDSWYLDANGRNTTVWPGTTAEFRRATRAVDLTEYQVLRGEPSRAAEPAPIPELAHTADPAPGRGAAAASGDGSEEGSGNASREVPAPRSPSPPALSPTTLLNPPPAAEETVVTSADGAPLHVELHGPAEAPKVVLVHGWTCSTAYWAPVIRALAAEHRVIAYDQRGHGRSPSAPGSYTTDVLADDLCAVLEATVPEGEQAVLVGHSMGAMTVVAAADRPPLRQRAAAVLLTSTGTSRLLEDARVIPLRPTALRRRVHGALLGSRLPLGPVNGLSRAVLRYGTMGPGSAPERVDACARIVLACARKDRAEWARVLATLDVAAKLPELTAPTEVLAGTADRLTPLVHSHRMARALPRGRLVELPGIGHMTAMEVPGEVTSAIRRLVADHLVATPTDPVPGPAEPTESASAPSPRQSPQQSTAQEAS